MRRSGGLRPAFRRVSKNRRNSCKEQFGEAVTFPGDSGLTEFLLGGKRAVMIDHGMICGDCVKRSHLLQQGAAVDRNLPPSRHGLEEGPFGGPICGRHLLELRARRQSGWPGV